MRQARARSVASLSKGHPSRCGPFRQSERAALPRSACYNAPMSEARIPPGQIQTTNWPVLHYGNVPRIDLRAWRFRVFGRVEAPVAWDYEGFLALPHARSRGDIHCVTGWTRLDNEWEGIPFAEVRRRFVPLPDARYVMVHAAGGWTTNVPLADLEREGVMFAFACDGEPLAPSHGGP